MHEIKYLILKIRSNYIFFNISTILMKINKKELLYQRFLGLFAMHEIKYLIFKTRSNYIFF